MKVRYTETALKEIDEILNYIAINNRVAAGRIGDLVEATVDRLAQFPYLGHAADERSIRIIQVGRYTVEQSELVILHVRHSARRRPWDMAQ
jgi:plasmid stabilization system protein ParE